MGEIASEKYFSQIGQVTSSPKILHIATHGFFFPDLKIESISSSKKPVFVKSHDPMIRSGLLMAGANHVWSGKSNDTQTEDGILTAYEISQMNLSNTELVVLSACETGLGDIAGNEGVYGLQRAFKIAGVKYLMMSLWQVPDRQTKDFMISFYKFWLNEKLPIKEAFKKAQNENRVRFYDPYFWAGFVLLE
jgi:CHAT domain-containing protein